jgi:hypothetical protein
MTTATGVSGRGSGKSTSARVVKRVSGEVDRARGSRCALKRDVREINNCSAHELGAPSRPLTAAAPEPAPRILMERQYVAKSVRAATTTPMIRGANVYEKYALGPVRDNQHDQHDQRFKTSR